MKKKFRKLLSDKCKDMGLTEKAIDTLTELGVDGMADDASDEDIAAKVDSLVPYAKAMQAEITRKTRKTQSSKSQSEEGENEGEENQGGERVPEWAKDLRQEFQSLKDENAKLKAEKAKSDRAALIAAEAKKRGIPDYLMKRVSLAEDADITKELDEYKQELITNNLMPKGQVHETGTTADQMKADAKSWAASLPDK